MPHRAEPQDCTASALPATVGGCRVSTARCACVGASIWGHGRRRSGRKDPVSRSRGGARSETSGLGTGPWAAATRVCYHQTLRCRTSARMTGGPNTTFSRRSSTSTSGKAHCASTTTIPRWLSSSTSPMITTSTIAAVGPQRGRHRSGGTPSDPCRKRWRGGTLCGPPLPGNLGMAPPAAAGLRCALLPPTSPPGPLLRRDTAVIIGSSGAQP